MTLLASDVMDQSAALLTDPSKVTFTYAYQLPFLKIAWDELQLALATKGIVDLVKTTAQATITAGAVTWAAQPTDIIVPIKMWEKGVGELDIEFWPMDQKSIDPAEQQINRLEVWDWTENQIVFRGSLVDRVIKLQYERELAAITASGSAIPVNQSKPFLVYKTAAILSRVRGNKVRADEYDMRADSFLSKITGLKVKEEQNKTSRPKPYGHNRRVKRRIY